VKFRAKISNMQKGGISRRDFISAAAALTIIPGGVLGRGGRNMKITNVPEANDYLHYEYRGDWTL